jgi:leucyl-tRNA synthetase
VRGTIVCSRGTDEATLLALARGEKNTEKWLNGKDITKVIYVPDKVLNLVVRGA